MEKGRGWYNKAVKKRGKGLREFLMQISAEIAVRSGSQTPLSVEIAEAWWWLLLRSATPRDARFVAARAIAPTEQRGG